MLFVVFINEEVMPDVLRARTLPWLTPFLSQAGLE